MCRPNAKWTGLRKVKQALDFLRTTGVSVPGGSVPDAHGSAPTATTSVRFGAVGELPGLTEDRGELVKHADVLGHANDIGHDVIGELHSLAKRSIASLPFHLAR